MQNSRLEFLLSLEKMISRSNRIRTTRTRRMRKSFQTMKRKYTVEQKEWINMMERKISLIKEMTVCS